MTRSFQIGARTVGEGQPCFIIAEAGVNHNGDLDLARRLADVAAEVGADAVKFQTFVADRLVTADAPKAAYQKARTGTAESQRDMLRRLELTEDDHRALSMHCTERGITFLSTPFDEDSVDLLARLDVPAYKVSSGELTNTPLLTRIASHGKPVILSTGMATMGEIEAALAALETSGNPPVALLQCVSAYPAEPGDINLRAMATLRGAFGVPVGYSDHTVGLAVPLASVAMGACILEKHITLDRSLPGPDQQVSAEPHELRALVEGVRAIEAAIGDGRKRPTEAERNTAEVARKSIVAARLIREGTVLNQEDLATRRPGTGLPPSFLPFLTGRLAARDIPEGTLVALEMLQ